MVVGRGGGVLVLPLCCRFIQVGLGDVGVYPYTRSTCASHADKVPCLLCMLGVACKSRGFFLFKSSATEGSRDE